MPSLEGDRPLLGRGEARVLVYPDRVEKRGCPRREPLFMRAHPGVFARVDDARGAATASYTMERLEPAEALGELRGGGAVLRKLWSSPERAWFTPADEGKWRGLLCDHLEFCLGRGRTGVGRGVGRLVDRLETVAEGQHPIHGDPTLANLLRHPGGGYRWCDPLERPYIPGDKAVDAGKMVQSCWGYERVVLSEGREVPRLDVRLALGLAEEVCEVPFPVALDWCYVHVIRLLRYQTPAVAARMKEVLSGVGL